MKINNLPLELLEEVFKHLSDQQKINASMVCTTWHKAALRNVTQLHCYDGYCTIKPERTYYFDYWYFSDGLQSDLKSLKKFYKHILKENVNWWDLFVHFAKLKHLDVIVDEHGDAILDAISSHLTELDHLFIFFRDLPEDCDWKNFGNKLTKLTSLKVEFNWDADPTDNFELMLPFCRNLSKIDISFVGISNTWEGVIHKHVTDVRFRTCWDGRTNRGTSLSAFIFQDPTTIRRFIWEEAVNSPALRAVDLVPLSGLIDLKVDTENNVAPAVFEHCKALEKLLISRCCVRQFSPVKHVLPRLKKFKCYLFRGNGEDLRQFCPNARAIDCGTLYQWKSGEHSE